MRCASVGSKGRDRLSKEMWLAHTLRRIGEVGFAAIQIESLAKDLGVTKGSFYWHFNDRDTLLSEALDYWYNSSTKAIGQIGTRNFANPLARLRYFFTLALERKPDVPGGPIEQAIREWARVSQIAAETTKQVDQDRVSLLANAYMELGQSASDAWQTAMLALSQIIGLNILMRSDCELREQSTHAFFALFLSDRIR